MATVLRRFISYVGKVKLGDFKDPKHVALVDSYCKDQESRVSIDATFSYKDEFTHPSTGSSHQASLNSGHRTSQVAQGSNRSSGRYFYQVL